MDIPDDFSSGPHIQKDFQKDCQKVFQKVFQKEYQKEFQKDSQKEKHTISFSNEIFALHINHDLKNDFNGYS